MRNVRHLVLFGMLVVALPLAAQRGRGGGGMGMGGLRPAQALVRQRVVQILMN